MYEIILFMSGCFADLVWLFI